MGDLSSDVERCLCDCSCDAERVQRAKCSCEEGRARETKRVLLGERQRLLDEMHASQRGIDAIDHMLYRVSCECTPPAASDNCGTQGGDGASDPATPAAEQPAPADPAAPAESEVTDRG